MAVGSWLPAFSPWPLAIRSSRSSDCSHRPCDRVVKRAMLLGRVLVALLLCLPAVGQSAPEGNSNEQAVSAKQIIAYTLPPDKLQKAKALYELIQKFEI